MKQFLTNCQPRWLRLAPLWRRAIVWVAVPVCAVAFAVISPAANAAKHQADPCKVHSASKACKAARSKAKASKISHAGRGEAAHAKSSKTTHAKAERVVKKSRSARSEPAKAVKRTARAGRGKHVLVAQANEGRGRKVTVLTRRHGHVVMRTRIESHVARRAPTPAERREARATARESVAAVAAVARGMDENEGKTTLSANTSPAEAQALRSRVAYVQDLATSDVLFSKNENAIRPIASISKLLTALVIVDANLPLDQMIEISEDDVDHIRNASSRLTVGTRLTRADMLHLALMSSENRAAHSLARTYPGGFDAFVRAMNAKAQSLGMYNSHFVEPTGLSSENVSSPHDLVRLMRAASQRPLIHRYTTDTEYQVETARGRTEVFHNSNALVRNADWDIKISKTGFINEAGECLVMLTRINGRDLAIVLLGSQGKYSRIGDAVRLRHYVQNEVAMN
jgi:D-alanyl-D-alanine endopeptidase (penicillin-binding protein 7)